MGDPGFKAAAAVDSAQESVTTVEVDIPAEATAGDRMLLFLSVGHGTADVDPPGWERLFETATTASGGRMLGWTAVAGSQQEVDPGETVTIDLLGASRAAAVVGVWEPSDVAAVELGSVSTMTPSPPYTRATPTADVADTATVVSVHGINGHEGSNDSATWQIESPATVRGQAVSSAPHFRNMVVCVSDETGGPGTVGGRVGIASHRMQAFAATVVLSTVVDRPTVTASTPTPVVAAGTAGVQLVAEAENGAGEPFAYSWTQKAGPPVALSDPSAAEPTFTAPNEAAELVFGVVVSDADGVPSLEATVTVTVVGASGRAVPVADVTTVGWEVHPGGGPAYLALADNDDGTWVQHLDPSAAVLEVALSELTLPQAGEPVVVSARVSQVGGSQGTVVVQLREGPSTVIAESDPHVWTQAGTVQEVGMTLTPAQVAAIADPAALRLRIVFTVI